MCVTLLWLLSMLAPTASAAPCRPDEVYISAALPDGHTSSTRLQANSIGDAIAYGTRNESCRLVIRLDSGTYTGLVRFDRPTDILGVRASDPPVIEGSILTEGRSHRFANLVIRGRSVGIEIQGGDVKLENVSISDAFYGILAYRGKVQAKGLRIRDTRAVGLLVRGDRTSFYGDDLVIEGSGVAGAVFSGPVRGWLLRSTLRDNRGCGVCAVEGAAVRIHRSRVDGVFSDPPPGTETSPPPTPQDEAPADSPEIVIRPTLPASPSSGDPRDPPDFGSPPSSAPPDEPEKDPPPYLPAYYNLFVGSGAQLQFGWVVSQSGDVGLGVRGALVRGADSTIRRNLIGLTVDDPAALRCLERVWVIDNVVDQPFEEIPLPSADPTGVLAGAARPSGTCADVPWRL
jgi:hypothetical protein